MTNRINKMRTKVFVLSLCIGLTACAVKEASNKQEQVSQKQNSMLNSQHEQLNTKIEELFNEAQVNATFVTFDGSKLNIYGNAQSRSDTEYVPASTFKMLNALIALEHRKATTIEIFKWDGKPKSIKSWEKDLTLQEAMQISTVPVYQTVAKRIGIQLMDQEIKRIQFGNQKIDDQIDQFWLVGPLKITPVQEAKFTYQLGTQ